MRRSDEYVVDNDDDDDDDDDADCEDDDDDDGADLMSQVTSSDLVYPLSPCSDLYAFSGMMGVCVS